MGFFTGNFQPKGKVALVLGASQGLGANIALNLYKKDCSVILVARRKEVLDKQIEDIISVEGHKDAFLKAIACDASDYIQCVNLWDKVISVDKIDPDYIFCCAGSSIPKLFEDLTGEDLEQGMKINYNTAVNCIHSGFKCVLAGHKDVNYSDFKPRHIVLFSSVVSFFPFIGYGQYAPSKSALESLSVILRQELTPYKYRVSCVFPGNFQSEGFDEEQKTKPKITMQIEGPSSPISTQKCTEIIFRYLDMGYDTITTDFIGWVLSSPRSFVLPKIFGIFQVILGFLLSCVAPILMWQQQSDINSYFKKQRKRKSD